MRYHIPLAKPLTRSLQRRKGEAGQGLGGDTTSSSRGAKGCKFAVGCPTGFFFLGLLGNSCGNELEKKCAPHATPNQFPLKAKASLERNREHGQGAGGRAGGHIL